MKEDKTEVMGFRLPKALVVYYIDEEIPDEIKKFCRENKVSEGFYVQELLNWALTHDECEKHINKLIKYKKQKELEKENYIKWQKEQKIK
jgi:hypothetical protein